MGRKTIQYKPNGIKKPVSPPPPLILKKDNVLVIEIRRS